MTSILSLTKKLISIKSIPENQKELEKILALALSHLRGYTVEKFENNNVKSALVYNTPRRPKKFKVILNAHLDVIPGGKNQYSPRIKGNKLYGIGSMDMKGGAACLITAFNKTANKIKYPLGLQLVTDEEIGGFNGTKHQVEKGVRADFVITGEPTNFDIVNETKGVLWLKISTIGKTAHGAYPWRGKNAVLKMNDFINSLKIKYRVPKREKWITTVNLGKIETSNRTFNKVPDDCSIGLDIRYISEDKDKILKDIKKILPKDFKMDIIAKGPAFFINPDNEYVQLLQKTAKKIIKKPIILRGANGSSDARHFTQVGCDGIEFGPIGGEIGSDHEWVNIPSLKKYHQIIKDFLLSIN